MSYQSFQKTQRDLKSILLKETSWSEQYAQKFYPHDLLGKAKLERQQKKSDGPRYLVREKAEINGGSTGFLSTATILHHTVTVDMWHYMLVETIKLYKIKGESTCELWTLVNDDAFILAHQL